MIATARDLDSEVEALLAESVEQAIERERTEFDRRSGPLRDSIVLFGARKLGRRTLAGLRLAGVEPLAFADNNPELWGSSIDGIKVFSPADAANTFGSSAVFVITIWGRGPHDSMADRQRQLADLGARCVVPFVPLYWKYAPFLVPHNALDLPHKVVAHAAEVERCFSIFEDGESRDQFLRQIAWRLTGDFDALSSPVPDEIYFPREIAFPNGKEVFIDCGAYDGDTLLRFLDRASGAFHKIVAFEPDPANLSALDDTLSKLPPDVRDRVTVLPYALGDVECTVRFCANGTPGSAVGAGDTEVKCAQLDEVLSGEAPTFIKMDIEAFEPRALAGAADLIRRCEPVIAACSYHVQDHVWTIPLLLKQLNPRYAILLRQHIQLVEDLVCYAAPRKRLMC